MLNFILEVAASSLISRVWMSSCSCAGQLSLQMTLSPFMILPPSPSAAQPELTFPIFRLEHPFKGTEEDGHADTKDYLNGLVAATAAKTGDQVGC